MSKTTIEYWLLLALAGGACLAPCWPPLPAWWLIAAFLWERRYGTGCAWERDFDSLTVYVGEAFICLPLIIVSAVASYLTKLGGNDE